MPFVFLNQQTWTQYSQIISILTSKMRKCYASSFFLVLYLCLSNAFHGSKQLFLLLQLTNNNPQTTINCSFSFDNNISLCHIINLNLIMNPHQSFKLVHQLCKFHYLDSLIIIMYVIVDLEVQIFFHFSLSRWMFNPYIHGLLA